MSLVFDHGVYYPGQKLVGQQATLKLMIFLKAFFGYKKKIKIMQNHNKAKSILDLLARANCRVLNLIVISICQGINVVQYIHVELQ